MLRVERLGNRVFAAEPFSQINQPAAFGTKRPEFSSKPIAGFFAGWTFDFCGGFHLVCDAIVWMPVTTFVVSSGAAPPLCKIFCTSLKIICCCSGERCELLKMA